MMDINEIIASLPQWKNVNEIKYEPLNGGFTNATYKVYVEDQVYAVRINGIQNKFLNLSREDEIRVVEKAALIDLAPRVLLSENKEELLITEFQCGHTLNGDDIHNPEIIKLVAENLKKVHSIQGVDRSCTPFYLIRSYLAAAEKIGVELPNQLGKFLDKMNRIEEEREKDVDYNKKYCHNDYFVFNMIHCDDGRIKVIDWELSGVGDVYFDLATLSFSNNFSQEEDILLLKNYFDNIHNDMLSTLNEMKFVCMIREVAWALFHSGMNMAKINHEMDYYQFALSVLERLDQGYVTL